MLNVVERQAIKLVQERWFSVPKAVDLAVRQQTKRWFWRDGKPTFRWEQYAKLDSKKREKARRLTEKWTDMRNIVFSNSNLFVLNG